MINKLPDHITQSIIDYSKNKKKTLYKYSLLNKKIKNLSINLINEKKKKKL